MSTGNILFWKQTLQSQEEFRMCVYEPNFCFEVAGFVELQNRSEASLLMGHSKKSQLCKCTEWNGGGLYWVCATSVQGRTQNRVLQCLLSSSLQLGITLMLNFHPMSGEIYRILFIKAFSLGNTILLNKALFHQNKILALDTEKIILSPPNATWTSCITYT